MKEWLDSKLWKSCRCTHDTVTFCTLAIWLYGRLLQHLRPRFRTVEYSSCTQDDVVFCPLGHWHSNIDLTAVKQRSTYSVAISFLRYGKWMPFRDWIVKTSEYFSFKIYDDLYKPVVNAEKAFCWVMFDIPSDNEP